MNGTVRIIAWLLGSITGFFAVGFSSLALATQLGLEVGLPVGVVGCVGLALGMFRTLDWVIDGR